jgi:hypothetical protein
MRMGNPLPALDDLEDLGFEPPKIGPYQVTIRGAPLAPATVVAADKRAFATG